MSLYPPKPRLRIGRYEARPGDWVHIHGQWWRIVGAGAGFNGPEFEYERKGQRLIGECKYASLWVKGDPLPV